MNEKKKILLGEKDIISKDNVDIFINLNLNSTFSEIRNDRYDNEFDVDKQFKKERNTSRDFRVYGTIDSTIIDCNNLYLHAYSFSGVNGLSGPVKSIQSTNLSYDGYNAYGKKRGKYLLELSAYTSEFVYIKIISNNLTYRDQIFAQQLIFTDADGIFVDYGTKSIDVDNNGNTIEISNDFYFLFNKHWVKKNLSIVEEKQAIISFSASPLSNTVAETPLFSTQTNYLLFSVVLDKPSPFGIEKAAFDLISSTLDPTTEIYITDENYNIVFPSNLTTNISFVPGQSVKNFYFLSPLDTLHEITENVTFGFKNLQYVKSGAPDTHTFYVTDSTPSNKVVLNFQNIYQNRNYFSGIELPNASPVNTFSMYPMPSVLRNGLEFEGTTMEFYPVDSYYIKIRNRGLNTILPENPAIGLFSDTFFSAMTWKSFNIIPQYQNTEKHSIKFHFKEFSTNNPGIYAAKSGLTINGMPIVDYLRVGKIDYQHFADCFNNVTSQNGVNYSGWHRFLNILMPFDVIENQSDLTITLTAKNPGTRLDIGVYGFNVDIFNPNDQGLQGLGITAETIQSFIYSAQTPLEIILRANSTNDTDAEYDFIIGASGYRTNYFHPSILQGSNSGTNYYLVSSYHNILRNWDNSLDVPIYVHTGVTSNWINSTSNGKYNSGEIYVNGNLVLANYSFNNTTNSNATNSTIINTTGIGNTSHDFVCDFLSSPIVTIPETSEIYSQPGNIINLANNKMGGYSLTRPITSTPAPIRTVTFSTNMTMNQQYSTYTTLTVSLNSVSTQGNESVIIKVIPGTQNVAYAGQHYTDTDNPLPITLTWAVGEKDKILKFKNIMPSYNNFMLFLGLEISSLVHVNPGAYLTSIIGFEN